MKELMSIVCLCVLWPVLVPAQQIGSNRNATVEELTRLVAKYLPGHSLRQTPPPEGRGQNPRLALLDTNGKPVPEIPRWQEIKGLTSARAEDYQYMGNPRLNTLLQENKTPVASRAEALDVARLIIGLGRGIASLDPVWEYSVGQMEGGWLGQPKYVGRPAMVQAFGACEVLLDSNQRFIELRDRTQRIRTSNNKVEGD